VGITRGAPYIFTQDALNFYPNIEYSIVVWRAAEPATPQKNKLRIDT
jgi:hypothetical protein